VPPRGRGLLPDVAKMAEALKAPGIDPRYWCSYGTVSVVHDDGDIDAQGNVILDVTDTSCVHVAPDGTYCDVVLQPTLVPVTCRYPGLQGGPSAQVITPIRPGDEVLVMLPNGSTSGPPVIAAILNSQAHLVPLGADRRPLFRNDRVLIYATDTPIDLRTANGTEVLIDQDGNVTVTASRVALGGSDATEQVVKGTSYRQAEDQLFHALQLALAALEAVSVGALASLQPGFTSAQQALANFAVAAAEAGGYLSQVTRTK